MTEHYKETKLGVEEFHMEEFHMDVFIITVFIICDVFYFYYNLYLK